MSRTWWTPLAFVIAALLLLLITPLVVDRRASTLRDQRTNGSEHGRVLLNDLEAAFAGQLLGGGADAAVAAARRHLHDDEVDLRPTMQRVGPEALARFDELLALMRRWSDPVQVPRTDSAGAAQARDVFATAERLDDYLATVSNTQRDAILRLERMNLLSALVLAPIALIAMVLVIREGQHLRDFAISAENRRAEVVRAADARAALLRGVTHDVKNPLGAAAGYAQLLEEALVGPLTPAQLDMIRRIRRLVGQSVDTVTDLLELARADSGGLHVEYFRTDLATLAGEVVDDHRGLAQEHELSIELATTPTPLVTDPRRVRQILSNLMSNAIKYTPPGGVVHVSVVRDPGPTTRVGVEVRDNGPGIPGELRSRLFEEFFRVSTGETATPGNGLGLAISRRIAKLLGGDVTYQDADSHGSVFTLWLDADGAHRSEA